MDIAQGSLLFAKGFLLISAALITFSEGRKLLTVQGLLKMSSFLSDTPNDKCGIETELTFLFTVVFTLYSGMQPHEVGV